MARSSARRKPKGNVISLDFTDVESGGGSGFRIKEGEYLMAVKTVEDTESDAGNSMFKWTFEGKEGAAKGKKFYLYTVYDPPDSLWKLRSLLEALGQEVPDGPLDLDLDEMPDLELIGHVVDEEYQNKQVSRLNDFSPVDGDGDDDDDDKKSSRGKKGKKEEEEEDDDKSAGKGKGKGKKSKLDAVSAEEVKAMDDDDMADLVERYDLDVELKEHKTPRRKASAIIAALEEKELLATD